MPLLEANALGGDPRAQYLLGALYLTGKSVTRNNSLGYAWLQVATSSNGNFVGWSDREAVELMLTMQPLMTGKDLVEADRTAAAIEAKIDTVRMELLRPALTLYSPAPAHMPDPASDDAGVRGVRAFLHDIAANPLLDGTAIQTVGSKGWDGFSIAIVRAAE